MAAPRMQGFSLLSRPKPGTPTPRSPKRVRAAALDDDNDDESHPKPATITEFGVENHEPVKEAERVIEPAKNTDWISEYRRKRQKTSAPQKDTASVGPTSELMQSSVVGGMTVKEKRQVPGHATKHIADNLPSAQRAVEQLHPDGQKEITEEQAVSALLGNDVEAEQDTIEPIDEDQAFQQGRDKAAADPTMDDYARVPVEGFGAALLRGYLRPGESLDDLNKSQADKKIEKRPALLGLGAKEVPGVDMDLGAWGKGSKDVQYNPLARQNVKNGQVLAESEFQARLKEQALSKRKGGRRDEKRDESRERERPRGSIRACDDDDRSQRHRSDRRDRDYDDRRDRDRDRDRSRRDDRDKRDDRRHRHGGDRGDRR